MTVYIIEGEWDGYKSSQRRVVHREYTTRKKFADEVRELGWIRFSDGTGLSLSVKERHTRTQRQPLSGYSQLIRDCLFHKVASVDDLQKKKKGTP